MCDDCPSGAGTSYAVRMPVTHTHADRDGYARTDTHAYADRDGYARTDTHAYADRDGYARTDPNTSATSATAYFYSQSSQRRYRCHRGSNMDQKLGPR